MSYYGSQFEKPPIPKQDEAILDQSNACLANGCEMMKSLAIHAMFNDGIVYSGDSVLRRVVAGYRNMCTATNQETSADCKEQCKFRDVRLHGIALDDITVDGPS